MQTYDLIIKKRDGHELEPEEIEFLISGYVQGKIPEYQMAALVMAIYFQGMGKEETIALTRALVNSGETIDLSGIKGTKIDKHSTGGVGDKVSLVLIPLLASLGFKASKMSGRGLGHTGGTVDKLEGIPGFRTDLNKKEFIDQVNRVGAAMIGQTGNLAPGDKKLYGLRDVTGTVDSIPLIASSIMSKKIAGGAENIILDVKFGKGAFMQEIDKARFLAETMVEIGKGMGRKVRAILSSMEQPLGRAVGNNIEVIEAINCLKGEGPEDLREVVISLAQAAFQLEHTDENREKTREKIEAEWKKGKPWDKFQEIVQAQGGNLPPEFPLATEFNFKADRTGFVFGLDARLIGRCSVVLGAGRKTKEEEIDHEVGIYLRKKIGERVQKGDVLASIYARDQQIFQQAEPLLQKAWLIEKEKPEIGQLIGDTIY